MSRLSRPMRESAKATPLNVPHTLLNSCGVYFRKGQFSLVASAPGVGKSLLAENIAIRTKVPTVFFSADSDEWTTKVRACSILAGTQLDVVDKHLSSGDPTWEDYYRAILVRADHIDWTYRTDIDIEYISNRTLAHAEVMGCYPHLIVVDNLGNTYSDSGDEYAELREACRELQRLARTTKAHVMALHHVVGSKENGFSPIGLGDLIGKIGKIPEAVLGLNWQDYNMPGQVILSVAKNRGGKANQNIALDFDYNTATVGGFG